VAVRDVRWVKGGTQPADDYIFVYGNRNDNHYIGTGFFVHKGAISSLKILEFISDRVSYTALRSRWCDIVLNIHATIRAVIAQSV
jgi:hypothetical protein